MAFDSYDSGHGREQILRMGEGPSHLLILPPLFDEMSRMRRTLVMAMRALAEHGFASALPDLPGLNESMTPLAQCRLSDWQDAIRRAAETFGATHVAGLRSGCQLDGALDHLPRWRHAPLSGERLLTQMMRAQMAGDKAAGRAPQKLDFATIERTAAIPLSGYSLNGAMLSDLQAAVIAPMSADTDALVETSLGPALWLRAEPGESAAMAHALAENWAEWMAQ